MTAGKQALGDVSRETLAKLESYNDLLRRWTTTINLIAPSTVGSAWDRHIGDCAQVFALIPESAKSLIDIGSGGGLPGLVLAIMAEAARPELRITLVESDQRKATFLRTVVRELALNVTVKAERIEALNDMNADVVTARAVAPLPQLLDFADVLLGPGGLGIFQKGRTFQSEIDTARQQWHFDIQLHVSQTDPDARILQIKDLKRATD